MRSPNGSGPPDPNPPTFAEMVRLFARIGCISFGGPAGQIALMHDELVDRHQWVEEGAFLRALNLCTLLPGPEAMQLATWIGWRLHGTMGGLAAGLLFVIPGAVVMLGLSILYAYAADLGPVAALFLGIKAAVLAIVFQALIRIAGRALRGWVDYGVAVAAFAGLFLFDLPFPAVVLGAFALGFILTALRPERPGLHPIAPGASAPARPIRQSIGTLMLWLAIWAAPMVLILLTLGPDHVLWKVGLFFSKLAVVSFGGAYSVLSYMAQQAVENMGWLNAREMADGLGLAETTPGPLILVTQFVGFLAGFHSATPSTLLPISVYSALLTSWVTFTPCFLWIFLFAPWMERLEHAVRLQGAMAMVTAAVVGVIANLALWFALHVLFRQVTQEQLGMLRLFRPDLQSLDWQVAIVAVAAVLMVFRLRLGMLTVLATSALMGLALSYIA
jgi:chromate transporter